MNIHFKARRFAAGVVIVLAFAVAGTILAQAQESNIPQGPTDARIQASGIVFPVQELEIAPISSPAKNIAKTPRRRRRASHSRKRTG